MLKMQFDKPAAWLREQGPDGGVAVCSQCSLIRNLADFPFPGKCSDDERRSVEEYVVQGLERGGLLASGTYRRLSELPMDTVLLLAERRLVPIRALGAIERTGLYTSDDFSLSVTVNGMDHVCITSMGAGLEFDGPWGRVERAEQALAESLDFAFNKRFGYLTMSLGHAGTGLKADVLLHLPAMTMENEMVRLSQTARERRHALYGLKPVAVAPNPGGRATVRTGDAFYQDLGETFYGDVGEAAGDLYLLTNRSTLGVAEEEILFHLRRTAAEAAERESELQATLAEGDRNRLEDRVGRALGVVRNARLLEFGEAMSLLSSLRLGVDTGLVDNCGYPDLNALLFASQGAHMKAKVGHDSDERMLSAERAALFRTRFSEN